MTPCSYHLSYRISLSSPPSPIDVSGTALTVYSVLILASDVTPSFELGISVRAVAGECGPMRADVKRRIPPSAWEDTTYHIISGKDMYSIRIAYQPLSTVLWRFDFSIPSGCSFPPSQRIAWWNTVENRHLRLTLSFGAANGLESRKSAVRNEEKNKLHVHAPRPCSSRSTKCSSS